MGGEGIVMVRKGERIKQGEALRQGGYEVREFDKMKGN